MPDQPRDGEPQRRIGGVTMAEIGRLAGVSQVTVSRALSQPEKVSPATLKRIEEAIADTGFVPNAVAGALASNKSRMIAALVPSVTNIVYASLLQAFSDIMWRHGYQIMLSETGFDAEREEKAIVAHLSRRPDAILLTGAEHSEVARRLLRNSGIPVVETWDMTESPIDCCIGFSHEAAGAEAADFAYAAGYRCAVTVTAGDERARRRRDGFVDRFDEKPEAMPVHQIGFETSATLGLGRQALGQWLERGNQRGTVIFCSSDLFAHGILIEAQARGLSVPEDLAVIGFGDQDFAAHTEPGLTSIRIDRQALGQSAATALLDRFSGRQTGPLTRNIGFELIRRGSA